MLAKFLKYQLYVPNTILKLLEKQLILLKKIYQIKILFHLEAASMTDTIEQQVKQLYLLAKQNPDDANLQTAAHVVEKVRRSRGSLQGWNERYRGDIKSLNGQIEIQESEIKQLQFELNTVNEQVSDLIEQKRLAIIQRDRVKAELRKIEVEVSMTVAQVKESHSWYGKFMILWNFIRLVFDVPPEVDSNGIVNNSESKKNPTIVGDLDDLNDKYSMKTDRASIQRDLLDR